MCPMRLGHRKKGFMDFDLYKKTIDDLYSYRLTHKKRVPNSQHIYLLGQGEPLLSKDIFNMIRYAKSKNFTVGLSTNATVLTEETSRNLIETGIDVVEFSVYALNRKDYLWIHGKDLCTPTHNNMIRFIELAKDTPIKTYANILVSKRTESVITQLSDYYETLPLNRIIYMNIRNFHGMFEDIGLEEEIEFIKKMTQEVPIYRKILSKLMNRLFSIDCIGNCPWNSTMINWNGDVIPCPSDYESRYVAGNVKHDNIVDVWNGEKYRKFRRVVLTGDYEKLGYEKFCNYCSYIS